MVADFFNFVNFKQPLWNYFLVDGCILCLQGLEDANHLFIHCPFATFARNIFLRLVHRMMPRRVITLLESYNPGLRNHKEEILCSFSLDAVIWVIQQERNDCTFRNEVDNPGSIYSVGLLKKGFYWNIGFRSLEVLEWMVWDGSFWIILFLFYRENVQS